MDIPPTEVSTRGAVPAAVTSTTGSTRPVTAPSIEAVVIAVRAQLAAGFLLDLDISGTRVEAASVHALPAGTRLQLRETAPGHYRVEELFTSPEALRRERIVEALRGELQRQVLPREVVNGLLRQAAAPGLHAPLQRAIEALLRRLPMPAEVQQPAGLRAALHNSGSFLEPRLLRALQQPAPGAPAAGAWSALRRLYGTLTATAPGTEARAPLPQPIAPPSPAALPLPTPAAPAAPAIPLPSTTVQASAKVSAPGISVSPPVPAPGTPSGTAGTAGTPTGGSPASLARTVAASVPVPGITAAPVSATANGAPSPRPGVTAATTEAAVTRVVAPMPAPLSGSRAPVAPANGLFSPGASGPSPGTVAVTQPAAAGTAPGAPPPSPVDSVRAPAGAPVGSSPATSPPQGTTPQAPGPQPTTSQGVPPSTVTPAPLIASAAPRPQAPLAPTPALVPAPGDASSPPSTPSAAIPTAPAPELPAAVLASDLKAHWQLLRAALANALSRAPAAPREIAGGVTSAPLLEAVASSAPALYTARGLLVAGAATSAPSGVPRVAGEATRPAEPGTVERLLSQVEGVLARTRVHQLAAMPESRPAAEASLAQAWVAEIPLLHPRGVDVLQMCIEEHRSHGQEGAGERHWQVMLSLDGDALGTLHALVLLSGQRLQATLWAEREATLQAARAALGELDSALRAQGVEVARLDCVPGRPPHHAMPVRERLLDVRT